MDPWGHLRIRELVHQGRRHTVYRATRPSDEAHVILKVIQTSADDATNRARLGRELTIAQRFDSASIVKAYAVTTYEGRVALVFEDFGGEALTRTLPTAASLTESLPVARGIALALSVIHRAGVVHGDVKPSNVIHRRATGEVKLTDFGIARARGTATASRGSGFEGTLPYMAPEQSGRMQRPTDHRADLYAFGVLLYEVFTGELPFHAKDALEWVHCHVAQLPRNPSAVRSTVPEALSRIVLRLLAKAPEERYQSAEGVLRDLERCEAAICKGEIPPPFDLGQHDTSSEFRLPSRVYGREEEVDVLGRTFARVAESVGSEVLLVSGYAGVGKTSLIRELEGPVARRGGHFAFGKFDQYRKHVPYLGIVQAGDALVEQVLMSSKERLATWRGGLLESLDGNGRVLVDLFPALERVLGPQPAVAALSPTGTQNRLHHAVRLFFRAFDVPSVLVLDDLQWADAASLDFLEALLSHGERQPLLAILAYRDHEVGPSHPFSVTLERIRASGTRTTELVVAPLGAPAIRRLVVDTVGHDDESSDALVELVLGKTEGNPFFVREFLRTLHLDGILRFDEARRAWTFDAREVVARGVADNVVALMMDRVERLPGASREALRIAAFLGDELDLHELAAIMDVPIARVETDLALPRAQGLVSIYDGESGLPRARFGHDRIQQAAYALTPESSKRETHLRIGRLQWSLLHEDPSAIRLFEIANHLDMAFELVTAPEERERLLQLFRSAARTARTATAYVSARSYLARVAELLGEAGWQQRFEETFEAHLDLAECDYLAGRLESATAAFADLLRRSRDDLERGRVYYLQIHLFQVAGDLAEAAALSLRSFVLFGLEPPETDVEAARVVEEEHAIAVRLLGTGPVAAHVDAPAMTDPRIRMLVDLLEASGPPIYMVRPALFSWVALKLVNLSLKYGNSEASCYGYGIYALLRAAVQGDIIGGYEFSQLAIKLNEKLGAVKLEGCMLHLLGDHVNFWKNPIASDLPILERGFLACVRGGDNIYSNYIGFQSPWHLYEAGAPLAEVLALTERYAAFARETNYVPVAVTIRGEQQFVRALAGVAGRRGALSDDDFDLDGALATVTRAGFGCGIVYLRILELVLAYTFGDFEAAERASLEAARELGSAFSMPIYVTFTLYQALTLGARASSVDLETRRGYLKTMREQHQILLGWARGNPSNFADKAALVGAEVARLEGDVPVALRLYEEARLAARAQGFVQYEALACELGAGFYGRIGVESVKRSLLTDALALYRRWGAAGKANALLAEHRGLEGGGPSRPNESAALGTIETATSTSSGDLDLHSVLKASQSLSAEILLPRLLPRLMTITIEYAGAVHGVLLLVNGEKLVVATEATIDDQSGPSSSAAPRSTVALPASILRYVERTFEHVLIDDAAAPHRFESDPYFQAGTSRSVLCKPIMRQGRLIGVFYLENPLVAGAFSAQRLATLEILASQTAISIENSRLYEASRAAVAARDEFLAIASHELKTPLAPLAMQVHRITTAITRGTLREMPEEALTRLAVTCDAQIRRLSRLVTTLLDVSRIESGSLVLARERVDLGELVAAVTERHAHQVSAAGCSIGGSLPAGVVGHWDRMRLEEVVTNLLMNALKFGRGRPIEFLLRPGGEGAQLLVVDHGVGVAPEDRERIFQRFERVRSAENVDGLGLGLFIVRAIAEAHGGDVQAEATPGGGATFAVALPSA